MDAKKFLREAARMCETQDECEGCPIKYDKNSCLFDNPPMLWGKEKVEKTIENVEKWAQEHPKKTRLMDFLEKYPNAQRGEDGMPKLMPWNLGYCGDTPCYACEKAEGKSVKWCWNQEVEEE